MRKVLFLTLLLASLTPLGIVAQVMGNYKYDEQQRWNTRGDAQIAMPVIQSNNEVTIDIKALLNVRADRFIAVFNIRQAGESALSVNELMAQRIAAYTADLATLGIGDDDIYIDMISQVPVYSMEVEKKVFSKSYNEVPMGFELQKNLHITYSDPGLLDEMIAMAAKQEIYDFVKTEYYSTQHQQHFDTLRSAAIALVNLRLQDYKSLGFELDTANFIMSDRSNIIYPISNYRTYTAYSSISIEEAARSKGFFSGTSVTRAPKSTSMYYNPPSYEQFDIVINPVITEPVIHYTYNLVVKYRIEAQKEYIRTTEKEYYILMPDGNLRKVELE